MSRYLTASELMCIDYETGESYMCVNPEKTIKDTKYEKKLWIKKFAENNPDKLTKITYPKIQKRSCPLKLVKFRKKGEIHEYYTSDILLEAYTAYELYELYSKEENENMRKIISKLA